MSAEHAESDGVGSGGETESPRGRLERFGDALQTLNWHAGEVWKDPTIAVGRRRMP